MVATALVILHVVAFVYVQASGMLYDQGGALGLLWWLVAFWVLPLGAAIPLIVSSFKRLFNHNDGGQ